MRKLPSPRNPKAVQLILFSRANSTSSFLTLANETSSYWDKYDEISQYAGVSLNVFERLWAAWYAYMQNDVLATGIMSFAMHEFVYFGRSLPWIIIDRMPSMNKYKIQGVRQPFSLQ